MGPLRDARGILAGDLDYGGFGYPVTVLSHISPVLFPCTQCGHVTFHVIGEQHGGVGFKLPFARKPLVSMHKGHHLVCNSCTTIACQLARQEVGELERREIPRKLAAALDSFFAAIDPNAPQPYTTGFAASFLDESLAGDPVHALAATLLGNYQRIESDRVPSAASRPAEGDSVPRPTTQGRTVDVDFEIVSPSNTPTSDGAVEEAGEAASDAELPHRETTNTETGSLISVSSGTTKTQTASPKSPSDGILLFVGGIVLGGFFGFVIALVVAQDSSKQEGSAKQQYKEKTPTHCDTKPASKPMFVEQKGTLAGKRSVQLVVEELHADAASAFLSRSSLQQRIERQLRAAGITVDKNANGYLYLNVGTIANSNRTMFGIVISLSYKQRVLLTGANDGSRYSIATTWEVPYSFASVGRFRASNYVNETIDRFVGEFVKDFRAANGNK